MNSFTFPIKSSSSKTLDFQSFMEGLAMERGGFYPFGINEFWHGGVHITDLSKSSLNLSEGVYCIADGEVVAYRINAKLIDTPAYKKEDGTTLKIPYSSSFTLVRHQLKTPECQEGETLVPLPIFSLYMHLLPWSEYKKDSNKQIPSYLADTQYRVKPSAADTEPFATDSSGDRLRGARGRIRSSGSNNTVVAFYPIGTVLDLEPPEGNAKRARVLDVLSKWGKLHPEHVTGLGYVWLDDLQAEPKPPLQDQIVTEIPEEKRHIKRGQLLGYVGEYNTPEKPNKRSCLHWEIFTNDQFKSFVNQARSKAAKIDKNKKPIIRVPKGTSLYAFRVPEADKILVKETGFEVLETLNNYVKIKTLGLVATIPRSQLDWDKTTRTYDLKPGSSIKVNDVSLAGRLKYLDKNGDSRTVLSPQEADQTGWIKKSAASATVKRLDYLSNDGTKFWQDYPEESYESGRQTEDDHCFRISELDEKKTDHQGIDWYGITGNSRTKRVCYFGYVSEKAITRHLPEEFICFDGNDLPNGDDASIYDDLGSALKQRHSVEGPSGSSLALSPFAAKVFRFLDENHDGQITLGEMQASLRDRHKQRLLARFITQHPTEWDGDLDRWNTVEGHMSNVKPDDWAHEKARIQKLAWWNEVKGKVTGFPQGNAYYFHPVGFVGAMLNYGCGLTAEILKKIIGSDRGKSFVPYLNNDRTSFGINSCHDFGHFFAQAAHESGGFRYLKELGGSALKSKSYYPYYGRGLIQLTWKKNYLAYGATVGEDVTSSNTARDKVTKPEHAVKSAFWFWQKNGLSLVSDKDDFIWITFRVNGGFNGYSDRLDKLKGFKGEFNISKISGIYEFSSSKAYDDLRASYGWGLWHDPAKSHLHGTTKDISKAKSGYYRTLEHIKAGRKVTSKIYGNKTTADLKKWATAHLKRLGGTPP